VLMLMRKRHEIAITKHAGSLCVMRG
jgi:hypothetical protein